MTSPTPGSTEHPLPVQLQATSKVVMLHMNYASRARAHGDVPSSPTYYLKPPSTLTAGGQAVPRPAGCELLISEGEVALIVGERAKSVPLEGAWAVISHIAAANDFTVLDWMGSDPSLTRWKGWDGFTPVGNLVDARTVDPTNLDLRVRVNGIERQSDSTSTLLFPFADLVSDLSTIMTLEPGDVILTGTPAGAGPVQPGDVVEVEIVGLSSVSTTVVQSGARLSPLTPRPTATAAAHGHAAGVASPRPVNLPRSAWERLRGQSVAATLALVDNAGVQPDQLAARLPSGAGTAAGHAMTVRQVPTRGDDRPAPSARLEQLAACGPDEVVVVEARGVVENAALPEDVVGRLAARQVACILTDGGMTDTSAPAPAVACAGTASRGWAEAHLVAGVNVPIALDGHRVEPGDLIVIDAHGCLVFPPSTQPRLLAVLTC